MLGVSKRMNSFENSKKVPKFIPLELVRLKTRSGSRGSEDRGRKRFLKREGTRNESTWTPCLPHLASQCKV